MCTKAGIPLAIMDGLSLPPDPGLGLTVPALAGRDLKGGCGITPPP